MIQSIYRPMALPQYVQCVGTRQRVTKRKRKQSTQRSDKNGVNILTIIFTIFYLCLSLCIYTYIQREKKRSEILRSDKGQLRKKAKRREEKRERDTYMHDRFIYTYK